MGRSVASKKSHTSPLRSKIMNLIIKFDKKINKIRKI